MRHTFDILRRPVLEVTLVCLLILILAQSLIGILSFSALNRLVNDASIVRSEASMQRAAAKIEHSLRSGKPLAQCLDLLKTFNESIDHSLGILGSAVVLDNGNLINLQGKIDQTYYSDLINFIDSKKNVGLASKVVRRPSGILMVTHKQNITLSIPFRGAERNIVGVLIESFERDRLTARKIISRNFKFLLIITVLASIILTVALRYFLPMRTLYSGNQIGITIPLIVLMLAQGLYAAYTISTFRISWLNVIHSNVEVLSKDLQKDLNKIFNDGTDVSNLKNVETLLLQLIKTFPIIKQIEIVNNDRIVLGRVNGLESLPIMVKIFPKKNKSEYLTLALPLLGRANHSEPFCGELIFYLSSDILASEIRGRAIDAMIVSIVALISAGEMLLILSLLIKRKFLRYKKPEGQKLEIENGIEVGHIARPIMFSYFFSWALPLGFLTLYTRSLPCGELNISTNLILALPISLEMACSFLTALIAGRLADQKGWQIPVLFGLATTFFGMLASAVVDSIAWFSGARGLVGLGYGLIWMGLQGFTVKYSSPNVRGRNITTVIAGLYAGHLSGAAVGGLLIEQIGPQSVFALGAIMLIVPLFGILVLMRPYMDDTKKHLSKNTYIEPISWKSNFQLLSSKDFSLVLLTSVIPFSIAQVGFLSFGLPLYLEENGSVSSYAGRILMLYGLCIIYLGPLMGSLADQTSNKKIWIILGGIIGSCGMLGLYFMDGIFAASIAVLFLAMASCCIGSSILPYILSFPSAQQYGIANITGLMRAADKLGQMAGPIFLGTMLSITNMDKGLALTGIFYLLTTLVFIFFSSKHN